MLLHGRGGHKDKYKDKDTDKDKYKVLQRPNVCYIFEEQGVLEDVRMVDMNMADMEDMDNCQCDTSHNNWSIQVSSSSSYIPRDSSDD